MSYQLGIDFGTTFLAAAVRRADGPVDTVALSSAAAVVPAALHLARDGGVTVGEGALRLAGIDAGRVVRAVKRRVGDPAPIVAGGTAWTPEDLSARMVRWVVDRVAEHEGGPAAGVVLAHPASWTAPVLERFAAALDGRGVAATLLAEPHAVALAHAAASGDVGHTVAVYDLGGGRCEAAVLRRDGGWPGFTLLGRPEGLPDAGGLDLDDVLWQHVRTALTDGTADGMAADARTRRACTRAKETLSSRSATVVRVGQGELRREVRLDRAAFESLIGPHVARTVAALRRTLASAELEAGAPATVLLAGGSSRIPLVTRMVADELGRPVTVVDEPELIVARGAALAGADAARSVLRATEVVRIAAPGPVAADPVAALLSAPAPGVSVSAVSASAVSERAVSGDAVPKRAIAKRAAAEPLVPEPVVAVRVSAKSGGSKPVTTKPVSPQSVVSGPVAEPVVASEPATVRLMAPVATAPVATAPVATAPEPVAPEHLVPERPSAAPFASEPATSETAASEAATSEIPTSDATVPVPTPADPAAPAAPRRFAPSRPTAVLEGARRSTPRRSLPRLLIGAGAVAAAALVVVALFRPGGPLDPPLDPGRDVAVRSTGAPVVPVPNAVPADTGPGAGQIPAVEAAPAEIRTTAPARVRPLTDGATDLPADVHADPAHSSVTTTPPAPSKVRSATARPASGGLVPPPAGAAPRVPPTPAAPGV